MLGSSLLLLSYSSTKSSGHPLVIVALVAQVRQVAAYLRKQYVGSPYFLQSTSYTLPAKVIGGLRTKEMSSPRPSCVVTFHGFHCAPSEFPPSLAPQNPSMVHPTQMLGILAHSSAHEPPRPLLPIAIALGFCLRPSRSIQQPAAFPRHHSPLYLSNEYPY
ncbi:hypothetical protein ACRALDRAFT_1060305 [Sodiomyces alcalophilus JCM 7366]|uniref:uncharacterized protein n=1 Tax=Sodiomyces alcalophilus JCM 7366 TaxID=591952 RepID=UPI0039B5CEEA